MNEARKRLPKATRGYMCISAGAGLKRGATCLCLQCTLCIVSAPAHIHRVLCPEIGTCPAFGCVVWRVKQKIGFQNVTHTGLMSRIEKNSQTRTVLRPAALPLGPTFVNLLCPTLPTFDQSMSLQDFGIHNSRIPELSGSLNF